MAPIGSSIPPIIVRENLARLAELMKQDDLVAVVLFDPSNMLAFTGTPHAVWDRLTCAAVTREGTVHLVCPAFERPAVGGAENIATIHTWQEHEDAYECFAQALRRAGVRAGKLGLDGRTWIRAHQAFTAVFEGLALQSAEHLIREVRIIKSPVGSSRRPALVNTSRTGSATGSASNATSRRTSTAQMPRRCKQACA